MDTVQITAQQLALIDPRTRTALPGWAEALNRAFVEFGLSGKRATSMYLGMALGESGGLNKLQEDLYYRDAKRCANIFYSKFKGQAAAAAPYLQDARKLANHVYAGIDGNGDEASGDGYRYRGVGPTQVTFARSIKGFFHAAGMPEDSDTAYLLTPIGGARISVWFFMRCGGHKAADFGACYDLFQRKRVGYALHEPYYLKAMEVLA